jgi:hypothetical protein
VGAVVAVGSLAALAGTQIDADIQRVQSPYPSEHLLTAPFSIPPRLFTKRWIALNTKGTEGTACVRAMLVDYETDRGQRERVWLKFRRPGTRSDWQREFCHG